jgi:hypothetical protein
MSAKSVAGGIWLAILIPFAVLAVACAGFCLIGEVTSR